MEKKNKAQLPEELKNDVKAMSEALSKALRFMTKLINDDTTFFETYYSEYNDIRRRLPLSGNPLELGEPVEIDMIMKADSLGLPVKRLIDTIAVIEQKLGGLDSADGSEGYSDGEEREHEADSEARAQKLLDEALARKREG